MMLITLEMAKAHEYITTAAGDAHLTILVHAASAAVLNYLKAGADSFLDSSGEVLVDSNGDAIGVPFEVQAATFFMFGYLFKNRDEDPEKAFQMGYLPAPVMALLYPLRDPSMA